MMLGEAGTVLTQPHGHEHKQLIHLLSFSLSVEYSINYMIYSMLYYRIGFMSDDFVQIYVHVSVLNMFQVGQAKPRCSRGWVY